MIAIRITAELIEELIENGYLVVSLPNGESIDEASVRRMWLDQDQGSAGVLSIVLIGERIPPLSANAHMPYTDCEVLKKDRYGYSDPMEI